MVIFLNINMIPQALIKSVDNNIAAIIDICSKE